VVAVSAGLVASFGISASAGPQSHAGAAPVTGAELAESQVAATAVPAVALTAAPPSASGLFDPTFGDIGFVGIAKPRPKFTPAPVRVAKHAAPVHHAAPPKAPSQPQHTSRSSVRHAVHHATTHLSPAPSTHHTSSTSHHSSSSTSHSTSHSTSSHSSVVAIAARYAGIAYAYGGTTPSGFDCSGFTSYVFRQIGISLPRTAHEQQSAVHRVSSPVPGDLVFFGSPASHVGIYAGGGMMWDSPHSGSSVGLHTIYGGVSGYGRP
jgi:cell wall-associated NlpC family hydrolase